MDEMLATVLLRPGLSGKAFRILESPGQSVEVKFRVQ